LNGVGLTKINGKTQNSRIMKLKKVSNENPNNNAWSPIYGISGKAASIPFLGVNVLTNNCV
jgi:hypothetical protein